jgi:hypothetical protein
MACQQLDVFQESLDEGIDSGLVITEIFRDNEDLIKNFPPRWGQDL